MSDMTDPTAGDRKEWLADSLWQKREERLAADPDAGDVEDETLARLLTEFYDSDDGDYVTARGDLMCYVAAVRRKAGDDRAEQILSRVPRCTYHMGSYPETCWWCDLNRAARIARESQ